eukprot:SAG11_NODE_7_length_31267_cov_19.541966_27_plen_115_part_00
MSPDVASKLLSDEGALTRLGGTQQKVTLLFSDIRGFSSISVRLDRDSTFDSSMPTEQSFALCRFIRLAQEGKEPGWVVNMLNGYFTHMIDVLYEQQGVSRHTSATARGAVILCV